MLPGRRLHEVASNAVCIGGCCLHVSHHRRQLSRRLRDIEHSGTMREAVVSPSANDFGPRTCDSNKSTCYTVASEFQDARSNCYTLPSNNVYGISASSIRLALLGVRNFLTGMGTELAIANVSNAGRDLIETINKQWMHGRPPGLQDRLRHYTLSALGLYGTSVWYQPMQSLRSL